MLFLSVPCFSNVSQVFHAFPCLPLVFHGFSSLPWFSLVSVGFPSGSLGFLWFFFVFLWFSLVFLGQAGPRILTIPLGGLWMPDVQPTGGGGSLWMPDVPKCCGSAPKCYGSAPKCHGSVPNSIKTVPKTKKTKKSDKRIHRLAGYLAFYLPPPQPRPCFGMNGHFRRAMGVISRLPRNKHINVLFVFTCFRCSSRVKMNVLDENTKFK